MTAVFFGRPTGYTKYEVAPQKVGTLLYRLEGKGRFETSGGEYEVAVFSWPQQPDRVTVSYGRHFGPWHEPADTATFVLEANNILSGPVKLIEAPPSEQYAGSPRGFSSEELDELTRDARLHAARRETIHRLFSIA